MAQVDDDGREEGKRKAWRTSLSQRRLAKEKENVTVTGDWRAVTLKKALEEEGQEKKKLDIF